MYHYCYHFPRLSIATELILDVSLNSVNEIVTMDCESPFDATVTRPGTIVVSPNHPNHYENTEDCQITVRFEESRRVVIKFLAFDIQYQTGCLHDWLEVRDGDSEVSNQIGPRLCGNTIPNQIISSGNSLTLVFHSDVTFRCSGFIIEVDYGEQYFII